MKNRLPLAGLALLSLAGLAGPLRAQNPDLMLSQEARDSILETYDNIFPILGRQAIERGFDLPKPLGINLIGLWVDQGIDIYDLGLSTGSDPIQTIDAFQFGDSRASILTASFRADLWVFPFLNVYGLLGRAQANTTVELTAPIPFTTSVDQTGTYGGIGLTGAFGIRRFFLATDVNWAWTSLEKLDEPVRTRVLSLRLGRAFAISRQNRLSVWAGAMSVKFDTQTNGSIGLAEALPPDVVDGIRDDLETIEDEPWYQDLSPAQQIVVQRIANALLSADYSDVVINYQLQKAPTDKWNMLAGANVDLGKRWTIRSEVGFIGRYSVLFNAVYRLDL